MRYTARAMPLRIPAVLAFTVLGAVGAAGAVAALGCGGDASPPDAMVGACLVYCIPSGSGSNSCTPATCATGPGHDVCPMGCAPDPMS
jgi:hypothetical protein